MSNICEFFTVGSLQIDAAKERTGLLICLILALNFQPLIHDPGYP